MWSSAKPRLFPALVLIIIIWRIIAYSLRRLLVRKFTVTKDIEHLGKARLDERRIRGNAVICGGSLAGLWAARICADHFENVIVIESEGWLASEEGTAAVCDEKGNMHLNGSHRRTRVEQYGCVHVYQVLLTNALRVLFPNFDEEMAKRDVRIKPADFNMHLSLGKRRPNLREPSGKYLETFFASRETYEKTLRALVRRQPNIQWMAGTVTDISRDLDDDNRIKSVSVREADGSLQEIRAALVIDCSGRSQSGFKWLTRLSDKAHEADPKQHSSIHRGKVPIEKTRMKYDIQCNSRTFEFHVTSSMAERMPIPGGYAKAGWLLTFFPQPGLDNRCIVMSKYEGNRIRLGILGWGFPDLPQTPQDIPDFLRSFKQKVSFPEWLYDVAEILLEDKSWVADTVRVPPCTYIRYDQAAHVPHNFIASGDAVMCANPIWGQGATKAAIGAIILDSILRQPTNFTSTTLPSNLSTLFFTEHHNKVSSAWKGTKPTDYGYDTTIPADGETLESDWLMRAFGRYLIYLAIKDKHVDNVVYRARMFLVPPTDMMHPAILFKMAVLIIKERLGIKIDSI